MDADGSDQRQLTRGFFNHSEPAWSPDGSHIAFVSNPAGESLDIYTMRSDGRVLRHVTDGGQHDTAPSWQPLCTITGTEGPDVLVGRNGPDVICGLGGDDRIEGRGGDDRLFGGPGRDIILGGGGDDVVGTGEGRDVALGGSGEDLLAGADDGGNGDRLDGGDGDDLCVVGEGDRSRDCRSILA